MTQQLWLQVLQRKAVLWNRRRLHRRGLARLCRYDSWCSRFDGLDDAALAALAQRQRALPATPGVGWLLDGRATPTDMAAALLAGLQAQLYPHWQLHVALDPATTAADWHAAAQRDARIRLLQVQSDGPAWQQQLLAHGDDSTSWVGFLEPGDQLRPHATLLLVEAALHVATARGVFADEDHIDAAGMRSAPHFKCQLHQELLLSHDCVGRPFIVHRALLVQSQPFAGPLPQAWRHHLALAVGERLPDGDLVHVPHVLLHRAAGSVQPPSASADAVRLHLQRAGEHAGAEAMPGFDGVRVRFALPQPPQQVTVFIPTRNGTVLLERCLRSLLRSSYPAFDVVVIDNGSDDPAALNLMQRFEQLDPRVRVQRDDRPFNFAALNNAAVAASTGAFVALVNDDIEFITRDWLEEMVSLATRPGIGAVGARLWYSDGTLQHGGVVVGVGGAAGHALKRLDRNDPGLAGRGWRLQNYSAVTAACLVVRRAHWLAVGGMDAERFAVAFNDVDFCLRLQAHGLRNVWTPFAEMFHHESVSRGRDLDGAKRERYLREEQALQQLHAATLRNDPAYSPNLTVRQENFALADPPRVSLLQPWFDTLA